MNKPKKRSSKFDYKRKTPEQLIHDWVILLEKLNKAQLDFWEFWQRYLAEQREKRIDDILQALWDSRTPEIKLAPYGRIVDSAYSTHPLCSYGSVIEFGRFNFGDIQSFYKGFQCLYLADSFKTAFAEKFHQTSEEKTKVPGTKDSALDAQELGLAYGPKSFSFVRAEIYLESVLDLTKPGALAEFCEIISEIKIPTFIKAKAQRAKQWPLNLVTSEDMLRRAIFNENFTGWLSLLNQPSPSQWIGHYTRKAGINGIIYPSVRTPEGINVGVFPDTFLNSTGYVQLLDKHAAVPNNLLKLDSSSFEFMQIPNVTSGVIH